MKNDWTLRKELASESLDLFFSAKNLIILILNYLLLPDKTSLFFYKNDLVNAENLEYQDFSGSQFSKVLVESKSLQGSHFLDAKFHDCTFFLCTFSNVILKHTSLRNGRYSKNTFSDSVAIRTDFTLSQLNGSKFIRSNFNHSFFRGAHLTGVKIQNSSFIGADFEEAKLSYTILENFPKNYFVILKKSKNKKNLLLNLLNSYINSLENNKNILKISHFRKNNLLNLGKKILGNLSEGKNKISLLEIWKSIKEAIQIDQHLINDDLIKYIQFFAITSGNSDVYDEIKKYLKVINTSPKTSFGQAKS
jgi:uncharacterized protein YjbI with pentapeptide repeats